jgi:hypothetical protein
MARYKVVDRNPRLLPVVYRPQDFTVSRDASHCICPAGEKLYSNGNRCTINGRTYHKYTGTQKACLPCTDRERCLRHPQRTAPSGDCSASCTTLRSWPDASYSDGWRGGMAP